MKEAALGRRSAIATMGLGLAAGAAAWAQAARGSESELAPGASTLADLAARLEKAPRRRDFKSVPMILDDPALWDQTAMSEVMTYAGSPKQVFDNVDLSGPWLNLMRNSLNAQIWSFKHPDFLVVSATHASAHLALLDQEMWDKYQLAKIAGGKFERNVFIQEQKGATADVKDFQNADGVFSPHNNSIPALQRRGVVFMACHNSIWEVTERLQSADINPDKLTHEALAAELTNHLVPGAVLTPGIVGTLPELESAGFSFAK
jgi:hypothetical protein